MSVARGKKVSFNVDCKYTKSFAAILAQSCCFLGAIFFYLFITKSRVDYAICFVQSGNTTATHGNALPFPRFPPAYKAADEISSKEFSGEFARVVKNANARKQEKRRKKSGVPPRG